MAGKRPNRTASEQPRLKPQPEQVEPPKKLSFWKGLGKIALDVLMDKLSKGKR